MLLRIVFSMNSIVSLLPARIGGGLSGLLRGWPVHRALPSGIPFLLFAEESTQSLALVTRRPPTVALE
jgi:hypothetical protein